MHRRELKSKSSQRRKKEKVEAFEKFKILPILGRKCKSSGGDTTVIRLG
jgi:hypothetical protein